jgi:hypothetical protein
VHYRDEQTGLYTHLLDFTKGTTSFDDFSDPALSAGQSWADPYSNLSITIDSIVNDTLNLTVTYGTTPCTRAAPTVTFTPANRGTHAAKPAAYTVTVKNNDSTSCSAATFTLDTTLPVGWPADAFTPAELTIDPQQSSTADFAKTPPASTAPGTYTIDATARHFSAPSLVGTGAASCTVMSRAVPLRANLVVPAVSYATGASIPITVTIRRGTAAVAGASVKYTLSRAGHQVATRTLVTGTNGQTKWFYSAAVRGDYSVSAWATKGTDSATSNYDTFTIN